MNVASPMHQRCTLRSQPRKHRRDLDLICEALRVPEKRSAFSSAYRRALSKSSEKRSVGSRLVSAEIYVGSLRDALAVVPFTHRKERIERFGDFLLTESLSVIKAAQHATDPKPEFEFTVCDEPAGARGLRHTKATNAVCSVIKRHR